MLWSQPIDAVLKPRALRRRHVTHAGAASCAYLAQCRQVAVAVLALPFLAIVARAQGHGGRDEPPVQRSRPTIVAQRIVGAPPTIDGRLDEPVWRTAQLATSFTQQRPTPGAPATERTEVRVLYDNHALYVGMRMYRRDRRNIAATVARRDYTGYSDWAQVMFDSYHDRRTAWRFAVNPAGVQKDVLEYDDGNGEDVSWDAVWEAAARIDSLGWTAEFRIPFSQLRFNVPRQGEPPMEWGVDFIRDDASKNERDYWAPIPPAGPGFVSWFGDLMGLRDVPAPQRLELLPYTLGSDTRAPGDGADPFFRPNDMSAKLGADIKYGLTANLTLTGALNPDFGQVEADPSVVNLTAFETFFPEQRPLFLEGEQFFTFNIGFPFTGPGITFGNDQPFYSRRIGRAPHGSPPDLATYSDVPTATTILGAAKLSGKTQHGWSIGVLDALTRHEDASYTDSTRDLFSTPVEPLTNYAVARVSKDFRQGRSAIGGMFTAVDRNVGDGPLSWLTSSAYALGFDGRHRFANDQYELDASGMGSWLQGAPASITRVEHAPGHWFQRPDAHYLHDDTTRTSLGGFTSTTQLSKIGGNWRWSVAGLARSPGFEVNDIGFEQSADWLAGGAQIGYVSITPGRHVRDWNFFATGVTGWSFGGERRLTGLNVNGGIDWLSNWSLSLGLTRQFSALSLDALRGGPALRIPALTTLQYTLATDTRRRLSATLQGSASRESETVGYVLDVNPVLDLRAGGRTELSLGPEVTRTDNPWQYIAQPTASGMPRYLLGRIRQMTVSLTARASYSFTPTLSLQVYAEPFISAGAYSEFKDVVRPRAARFTDRFHAFTPAELSYDDSSATYHVAPAGDPSTGFVFANPDFNFKQFRSTTVLRWEYRPGSTIFVVWSQGRSLTTPIGTLNLDRDVGALFGANATNTLVVKVNYWVNW